MTRLDRVVRVADSSEVAGARRAALECAGQQRMSENGAARAALAATELATNLLKHGGGGSIVFGAEEEGGPSLTIVALDKGRGIPNVNTALSDGFSTAGSNGTGLGAVSRAATFFDLYTLPGHGTAVLCRIEDEAVRPPLLNAPNRITVGGICVPMRGEQESGDAWLAMATRDVVTVAVIDGLGHGHGAATASAAAMRSFAGTSAEPLERMLQDAHAAMRSTRGAAVGISRIHATAGRLDFAGVGNIAGIIDSDESSRRVVSLNGIVGHEMRKVQTYSYPWTASAVLVMQSDGVSASWNGASYPGLTQRDPALIAAVLYRDHVRGTDDATVVVAKAS
jgi:anti-sigma regulatory factor (Ser/Thr protein kinase)